jgi:galactose mutarotase-like enzyme
LDDSQISENLRKDWPNKFKLFFTVTLNDDTLRTNLSVKNESTDKPFDFQALLHTYYFVPVRY